MSRMPSAETQLKTTKRLLNDARREVQNLLGERNAWRIRAGHATAEAEEWKRRFDALLKIVPEKTNGA